MKHLAIALALFLGLVTSTAAQEAKQVRDQATFLKVLADKQWTHAWGTTVLTFKSNGTFSGKTPKGKLEGTWYWKGKKWCRTGQMGSTMLKEECQKFYMIGNRIMKNVTKSAPKGNYYFLR
ncbi:hypothetical protein [Planktotalea sp.]|uniref:hypothetical protein n=1 Tax=Planktotalea sp. TaxID=2029877 RepID=UPI0035C818D4